MLNPDLIMEVVVKTLFLIMMVHVGVHCEYLFDECGTVPVTSTINNGYKVDPHRYPWQVWIIIDSEDGLETCGGSIITEKHVLTAAHCLFNKSLEVDYIHVIVGTHDTMQLMDDVADGIVDDVIEISDIKLYPGFNEASDFNRTSDIAILTLNQTLRKR